MVELIGDVCRPIELIVPTTLSGGRFDATVQPRISGALFMSGANLLYYNGKNIIALSGAIVV